MKKNKKTPITHRGVALTRLASKQFPNDQGITLISLAVTIIILLILAGVTLALISGSDGILGRASHALDENKIAMAKEQVELALSDFQTEFYEGKYVERTNNGTKKDYISEKLQEGVETTNFYAQASAEGNVTVYEGKDTFGTEVVKGAIQDDASIKWDDVKLGDSGENGGSSEGGNGAGGEEENGNISSGELEALKAGVAQLQGQVNNLNNKLEASQQELANTKNTLDSILTSQTRKDILYIGSANKIGSSYNFNFPAGKKLTDYKIRS